jgi:hypothetical protein
MSIEINYFADNTYKIYHNSKQIFIDILDLKLDKVNILRIFIFGNNKYYNPENLDLSNIDYFVFNSNIKDIILPKLPIYLKELTTTTINNSLLNSNTNIELLRFIGSFHVFSETINLWLYLNVYKFKYKWYVHDTVFRDNFTKIGKNTFISTIHLLNHIKHKKNDYI